MKTYPSLAALIDTEAHSLQEEKMNDYFYEMEQLDSLSVSKLDELLKNPEHKAAVQEIFECQEDTLGCLEYPHLIFSDIITLPSGEVQYQQPY